MRLLISVLFERPDDKSNNDVFAVGGADRFDVIATLGGLMLLSNKFGRGAGARGVSGWRVSDVGIDVGGASGFRGENMFGVKDGGVKDGGDDGSRDIDGLGTDGADAPPPNSPPNNPPFDGGISV